MVVSQIEPLDATFGAIVHDLSIPALGQDDAVELIDAWHEFGLLIFPDQHLTREQQDDFARRFGDLEFEATALTNIRRDGSLRSADHELSKSLRGNEQWHHDSTYMPIQAKGAVFTAEVVPDNGGATGFADMRAAYDALDDDTRRRVDGLSAHHSRRYSMERAGHHIDEAAAHRSQLYGYDQGGRPPLRPLVATHAATGRRNLVIGQHAFDIPGLDEADSEELLDRLTADACIGDRVYHHRWTAGDALLWDNRRLMHRATPHDPTQPRRMWHTRIAGDPATETATNYR